MSLKLYLHCQSQIHIGLSRTTISGIACEVTPPLLIQEQQEWQYLCRKKMKKKKN